MDESALLVPSTPGGLMAATDSASEVVFGLHEANKDLDQGDTVQARLRLWGIINRLFLPSESHDDPVANRLRRQHAPYQAPAMRAFARLAASFVSDLEQAYRRRHRQAKREGTGFAEQELRDVIEDQIQQVDATFWSRPSTGSHLISIRYLAAQLTDPDALDALRTARAVLEAYRQRLLGFQDRASEWSVQRRRDRKVARERRQEQQDRTEEILAELRAESIAMQQQVQAIADENRTLRHTVDTSQDRAKALRRSLRGQEQELTDARREVRLLRAEQDRAQGHYARELRMQEQDRQESQASARRREDELQGELEAVRQELAERKRRTAVLEESMAQRVAASTERSRIILRAAEASEDRRAQGQPTVDDRYGLLIAFCWDEVERQTSFLFRDLEVFGDVLKDVLADTGLVDELLDSRFRPGLRAFNSHVAAGTDPEELLRPWIGSSHATALQAFCEQHGGDLASET